MTGTGSVAWLANKVLKSWNVHNFQTIFSWNNSTFLGSWNTKGQYVQQIKNWPNDEVIKKFYRLVVDIE